MSLEKWPVARCGADQKSSTKTNGLFTLHLFCQCSYYASSACCATWFAVQRQVPYPEHSYSIRDNWRGNYIWHGKKVRIIGSLGLTFS